jgi:hypothetical protein
MMTWNTGTNAATDQVEFQSPPAGTTTGVNTNQPYVLGQEYHIADGDAGRARAVRGQRRRRW